MKHVAVALVLLLALASVVEAADRVRWVPSLELALKQAKQRGAMIFVTELVSTDPDNLAQADVFKDPAFIKASKSFVCLFACPNHDAPMTKMVIDGEEVRTSELAPGITREDHMNVWNEIIGKAEFAKLNTNSMGDMKMPFSFVADANGKHLATIANGDPESGFASAPLGSFLQAFSQLLAKHGRGLTQDEYEEFTGLLEKASQQLEAGERKKAFRGLSTIVKRNDKTAIAEQAKDLLEKITQGCRDEIRAAEGLVEKDPPGAVIALEKVMQEFSGTPLGTEAKNALTQLKKQPAVKNALKEVAARRAAEKLFTKAEAEIAAGRYSKGLSLLDTLAKRHEGSEIGNKAKARADELRADPEIADAARDAAAAKDCRRWLSMGRNYAKNGMPDKARGQFQKVIDKYPETTYAAEAAVELKKLP